MGSRRKSIVLFHENVTIIFLIAVVQINDEIIAGNTLGLCIK
jgi:hypothetical protein